MITGMPRIAIAVNDFDAILSTFRDKFGMPVVDVSESSMKSLGAKIAMCVPESGSNIELMAPGNPEAPLSQSLSRFLDRRGEGLFALMLEAPDPDVEAEGLLERGLAVLPLMEGAGGRDVHPKSTHGVLIRVYPTNSFKKPPGFQTPPTDEAGLSGVRRVVIAVQDLDQAIEVYGTKFAMDIGQPKVCAERGVRYAICNPPTGGTIELVAVDDTSRPFAKSIQEFLSRRGDGLYALVLQSADVPATAKTLQSRGLDVAAAADSADAIEVDRPASFGALIRIEPAA